MKKIMLGVFLMVTIVSYSQAESDTLFVSKCNDIGWASRYRNADEFGYIQFEDGSVLKAGDFMKIGSPSGTNLHKEVNAGLLSHNVSTNNQFSYMQLGRMASQMLNGVTYLPESYKLKEYKLVEIRINHSGFSKNSVAKPYLIFDAPGMDITTWQLNMALQTGELINLRASMTREKAIAKLKEQKELMDLGMINKEEFEKIKSELTPIIMK
jgi:hypothetical protein